MKTTHIPFIKYQALLVGLSALLFVAAVVVMVTKGFNYGIDFKGGAKLAYKFEQPVHESQVREALAGTEFTDASVVRFGEPSENRMSIKVALPEEHAKIGEALTAVIEKGFGAGKVRLEQEETVGPRVGKEMRKKAWLTIIFSWAMMLIYIGYRFDFLYAPGAVISLMHDTVITMGILCLLGKEINLTILAAILTLIGYSINDTIVVFDRIRENKHRITPATIRDVVNESINSTLSRTIITSLTVFLVVVVLFFKGGGTLHDFAFTMIIGVIIGTYSSIFVASPFYIWLYLGWPTIRKLWAKR
jgi:preprotein translocase subunit SecF